MPAIMLPEVGEIVEAVRLGVESRLGRRRRIFTGEDLIEDVGLTAEQFEELVDELEERLSIEIAPDTVDQFTVVGALVVHLLRLCSRPGDNDELKRDVA